MYEWVFWKETEDNIDENSFTSMRRIGRAMYWNIEYNGFGFLVFKTTWRMIDADQFLQVLALNTKLSTKKFMDCVG